MTPGAAAAKVMEFRPSLETPEPPPALTIAAPETVHEYVDPGSAVTEAAADGPPAVTKETVSM
jgi:hypothetical protein